MQVEISLQKLYKASPSDRFIVIDICQTQVQAIHFSPYITHTPPSPTRTDVKAPINQIHYQPEYMCFLFAVFSFLLLFLFALLFFVVPIRAILSKNKLGDLFMLLASLR